MLDKKNPKAAMLTFMASMLIIVSATPISVCSTAYLTEVVSTNSTVDSWHPSLAVDHDGNIHVAWYDWMDYGGSGHDRDVFYKARIGGSWTATEVVSTESTSHSDTPSLAIDSDGNIHVAWHDWTDYGGSGSDWDVFYKARIGGSWTATEVVSTESTDDSFRPSLAVDPDGNIHVAWHDHTDYGGSGVPTHIFYKAKIGGSWTATEVVSTESTSPPYNPSLAIDSDGNIHVAWMDGTNYDGAGSDHDVFYKARIGGSWTATEVVSTESTSHSDTPSLAIDSDGNIHVAWEDYTDYGGSGSDWDVFYKAKIGGSWTATEVVSTESIANSGGSSLAVAFDGDIHVAWWDITVYGGSGDDTDIFYKARIDGIWTATEVISTESSLRSLNPSLAVDHDGNIHVAWEDHTDYGGADNDQDVFYKHVEDIIPLSDIMKKLGEIESKVDSTKAEVDAVGDEISDIIKKLGEIESKVDSTKAEVDAVGDEIDAARDEIDAIEAKLDDETRFTDKADLSNLWTQLKDKLGEILSNLRIAAVTLMIVSVVVLLWISRKNV